MCVALVVVVISFLSFVDDHRGGGADVMVGPRALIVFSCFAASICAALLTGVPMSFFGSLTMYKVVPWFNTSPTCQGICLVVVIGCGARILRLAHKTVCVASCSIVAASCLAASCFLYALTWASYWRGWVGAGIDEVDGFLGEDVVLLP